jgi:hypothetical protein
MAASVQQSVGGEFRPTEQDKRFQFAAAVAGDGYYVDRIMGEPHFKIRATTDTNTAASATNFALDLAAEGLTAATGALTSASSGAKKITRDVIISAIATNGANRYKWRQRQRVGVDDSGNAILIGPVEFLTDCYARYVATTNGSTTTVEVAAECKAPAWWDGSAPVAGAFNGAGVSTVQWLGGDAPVGVLTPCGGQFNSSNGAAITDQGHCHQRNVSLTNGTSDLQLFSSDGTEAMGSVGAGRVEAEAYIEPPMAVELFVDTATTPDRLLVCLVGISSDVVTWQVDVTIGDPIFAVLV